VIKKGSEGIGVTRDIQVRVTRGIIAFNSIVIIIGIIIGMAFSKNWKPFVLANIYGSIAAILNFRLLAISTEQAITMESSKVPRFAGVRALVRLFITGMVLYVALTSEHINAIGTIIGLWSIKPILLIENLTRK